MPTPPQTPAEKLASILLYLSLAVDGPSMWGRIPRPLGRLILDRIIAINQFFARIAARIAAGTFVPRRAAATRRRADHNPRKPNPLPQDFAWLVKLLPEVAAFGGQLQQLLADPEMAAVFAAAPGSLRRPLRSLCRMLGVTPPPLLARPPAPAKPPAPARRTPPPAPPRPPRPPMPLPMPAPRVHRPPRRQPA